MTTNYQTARRQFLRGMAAGSAGLLISSGNRASGYQSPNERPVFATIGLRNQGWAITSKSTRFADFAALADVDANVLGANVEKVQNRQGKKPDFYKDYRKVLDRKDIEAVMIATPDHWHTKIAVESMLAGKDVYCEKPLTLTIDEGKLIEKVVKQTGRVFSGRHHAEDRIGTTLPAGYCPCPCWSHWNGQKSHLRDRWLWSLTKDSHHSGSRSS